MGWSNSAFPFFLQFIPLDLDPDPQTQINPDPTGSGSTTLDSRIRPNRSGLSVTKWGPRGAIFECSNLGKTIFCNNKHVIHDLILAGFLQWQKKYLYISSNTFHYLIPRFSLFYLNPHQSFDHIFVSIVTNSILLF